MASITFLGAAQTVTGSKHLLDTGTARVLVDAGLFQGLKELRERNWQPVVHIDGPFAAVWTPYDFHAGDEFSHCGTDVFLLARIGGAWRITGGSYTVQPEGCDPSPPGGP